MENFKNVMCPQCKTNFKLVWKDCSSDEGPQTLFVHGCPTAPPGMELVDGDIYYITIKCPHCNYEEEI